MTQANEKQTLRIYLSGGMEYASDEGRDWRERLHDWLEAEFSCEIFNPNHESESFLEKFAPGIDLRPLKLDDPIHYRKIISELFDLDCREIAERSDLVICYWDEAAIRGAGTKGELTIARYFGKPVYMVTSIPQEEIPGWVLACTTEIFPSFDELKTFLKDSSQAFSRNIG